MTGQQDPPSQLMRLNSAIRSGDLLRVRALLQDLGDEERHETLFSGEEQVVEIKRPFSGVKITVRRPTPLVVAVKEWFPEIVEYLCSLGAAINECVTVEDDASSPRVYGGVTALHLAAITGKLSVVQTLIQYKAQVDARTDLGHTSLFEACLEGHLQVVQVLVEHGADVEVANLKGVSCLSIAAYSDNADVIKFLVESAHVNLKRTDQLGRNVLFYTVAAGRMDSLAYFMDSGVPVEKDSNGVNILMEAVLHRNKPILEYIIKYHQLMGLSLDDVDSDGRNALFYALFDSTPDTASLLLEAGIPLERMSDGRTLLMASTLRNNTEVTKYFCKNAKQIGVNIQELDEKGRSVLFYCVTGGSVELLEYLVRVGVTVTQSADGVTLLMQAVAKNRTDFVAHFLKNNEAYGLNANSTDEDGWNAVFYATASANLNIFRILTTHGLGCSPTNDGRTVLMQAASRGRIDILEYILDNAQELKVYIHQVDNDGWNVLFFPIQGGHMEAFQYLIKRGAKSCVALNGSTLLMEAVDKNQLEFVQYLIKISSKIKLDINAQDQNGNTALVYAVANGNFQVFQILLDAGCSVVSDKQNRTLLMQASLHGHDEFVRHLVNFSDILGLDIHQMDGDGRNALFYAVEGCHLEIVKYLITCKVSPASDNGGRSNLMQAARAGCLELVRYFVENSTTLAVDINAKDKNGENALFFAARSGRISVINYLLEHGIEVISNKFGINILAQSLHEADELVLQAILNSQVDKSQAVRGKDTNGMTVLHHFIRRGDLETLKSLSQYFNSQEDADSECCTLLMYSSARSGNQFLTITKYLVESMKVDIHVKDNKQQNALFHAVAACNTEGVDYLLDAGGSSLIVSDHEGRSPIHVAAGKGHSDILELLLKATASKNIEGLVDKQGRSPMHYCAQYGQYEVISLLKTYNCDINGRDQDGCTPLMFAVREGLVNMVGAMLKKAAEPNICDNYSRSALHYSYLRNEGPEPNCVRLLIKFGAELNHQDSRGTTALMLACQFCAKTDISMVRYLLDCGADTILQDLEGRDAFDYCAFDAEYCKALMRQRTEMPEHEQKALLLIKPQLLPLDMNSILRGLLNQTIFTKTLNFEVMKKSAPERIARLLELLFTRGPRAFSAFSKVLKDMGEKELAYALLKDSYIKEIEYYL